MCEAHLERRLAVGRSDQSFDHSALTLIRRSPITGNAAEACYAQLNWKGFAPRVRFRRGRRSLPACVRWDVRYGGSDVRPMHS